jgi:hypothetical protein
MADLFRVTAPLVVHYRDGRQEIAVERFRHPEGLLYFTPFWHRGDPAKTIRLLRGEIRGEGPWRIGEAVIRVLGCQGAEPGCALEYETWQAYLATEPEDYPPRPLIEAIARRLGAFAPDTSVRDV